MIKRSRIYKLLELAKRRSNEACFDYFEQFGKENFTIVPELFQLEQEFSEFSTAGSSRGVPRSSGNLGGLQGLSISDYKFIMAVSVASLTENFQSVNDSLEGIFVSHHKCSVAAALATLIENLQTVNEALEGLYISDLKLKMADAVPCLTETFQGVHVALEKGKKDLSRLIMKEKAKKDLLSDDLVQSSDKALHRAHSQAGTSRGLFPSPAIVGLQQILISDA